jgi:hypothetical protein
MLVQETIPAIERLSEVVVLDTYVVFSDPASEVACFL